MQTDFKSLQFVVTINSIIIKINQLSYYSLMTSIYYSYRVNGKLLKKYNYSGECDMLN